MGKLSGFKYRTVIERLWKLGFELDRLAGGSHEIWWNPSTRRRTVVPHHSRDIEEGTLRNILREAGITPGKLRSYPVRVIWTL
jgi:predicted RNA binding protein YcfA (HicA-like mRNA interferase family)